MSRFDKLKARHLIARKRINQQGEALLKTYISMSIILNTPPSNRAVQKFKAAFPNAVFMGRASLGSKRQSFAISEAEYNENRDKLKKLGITKHR